MEPCRYKLSIVIIFVYFGNIHEILGDKVLGIGMIQGSDNNYLLFNFICPGEGKYAVKQAGNCGKYFDCAKEGIQPSAIMECDEPEHFQFHRLNRSCVQTEYVNCRWCRKPGIHADKTSPNHFIQCTKGTVGYRYKCRNGKYNVETRECENIGGKEFDIKIDAELDLPVDIVQFQKDWYAVEKKEDEEELKNKKHHHDSKRDIEDSENDAQVVLKRGAGSPGEEKDQSGRRVGGRRNAAGRSFPFPGKDKKASEEVKHNKKKPKANSRSIEESEESDEHDRKG